MEKEIVQYLCDTYDPEAILLAGSRVQGTALEDSDWDVFVIGAKKKSGVGFTSLQDSLLDITLKEWPKDGASLTIPYGPLWPVKVLFDNSGEKLKSLLKNTEQARQKGPLDLYRDVCLERLGKLNRWQGKIEKYQEYPEIQFYYAGIFYEFVMRSWFEIQNLWPLSPKEAFAFINQNNPDFGKLLTDFVKSSGKGQSEVTMEIMVSMKKRGA